MSINLIGTVAGLAAFLGIWGGHVAVRKIEFVATRLWPPVSLAVLLGLLLEALALRAGSPLVSAACGILGATCLWDGVEFLRQQRRVQIGHAPANPRNPRHARIMAAFPQASSVDWLDRSPRGAPYTPQELSDLKASDS